MITTTEHLYQLFLQHPVISTDTRKIAPGSLFFALKGDKFDANTFAKQAIEAGAAYAVIDNSSYQLGDQYLLVDDVLAALQDLARHHRRQLNIPVVGLTGTNGKTTTKELINSVLSQHFKTQATQGNLNNHIGVPLTILTIDKTHQAAVIEMGANHQKEIELLCSISQPSHGLITNVGKAHLEGFGGVEGVKKGKGELYDYLKQSAGVAFVNGDNTTLMEMKNARGLSNVILYGTSDSENLVSGKIIDNSPLLTLQWTNNSSSKTHNVKTQLTGAYNLDNILATICIGVYFKLSDEEINKGIESYQPKNNRSQIVQTASNTLICDYYNANPSSMFVAVENIGKLTANRKVLILGDMFEMGDEAAVEHEAVIKKAMGTPVDERIFIGKEFQKAGLTMGYELSATNSKTFYATAEDAIAGLKANPIKNSTILIKGSRGMALERLVELF
ncbi:UDP-N-acetylmuramoyl-tripeptide--D-alanyl-D-alanine ligase [Mucilaginibacter sp. X4EP1]|uniref:UDP-N-acetylmuramoyl-tripeptide--D-alanyl-D- alanine ligase n=1 Tax=Mucilaginibacter sp. X4EP1 TaxID=2723092 RepID=UPI00216810A4|nr:UDP-N-acetylmuramoyl-tripeptide--D-alanyl-D-alanine ligase [Mucilaginibacter sp. X4EP1]MCS3814541.1 UDP-N-acetylmuramoyl-tripeptide--D-alanyl-D-alanine ligase [Mucilaginibacter sp. X4EP1]